MPSLPVFPADLERVIFELCATSRPSEILMLLLVAWRVKAWFAASSKENNFLDSLPSPRIEPLLYRTVMLSHNRHDPKIRVDGLPLNEGDALIHTILSRPPQLIAENVRNLFLNCPPNLDVKLILSGCPNVENLWICADCLENLLPILAEFPSKHLYCSLYTGPFALGRIDFTHKLFAQITHLELFDSLTSFDAFALGVWSRAGRLSLIPNLTNFAFSNGIFLRLALDLLCTSKSMRGSSR
ncbi:hypothetical protein C8R43DRAFT_614093 [Mycena crocata]|nr:hypothetical protein C8R43DRAFT_614093 [Mycena crocata]